jgi:hypothetical protein
MQGSVSDFIRPTATIGWDAIPFGLLEYGNFGSGGAFFSGEPENAGFVSKEAELGLAVILRAGRDAVSLHFLFIDAKLPLTLSKGHLETNL